MSGFRIRMLVAAVVLAFAGAASAQTPLRKVELNVGLLDLSSYQQVFQYYDAKYGITAAEGRKLGLDLHVVYKTFPRAPEMLAGMKAGDVQVGCMATFPFISQIKQGVPLHPLWNPIGSYEWLLMVNKDSPIRTLDDLKGKRIGLGIGTEDQLAFENFVMAQFGHTPQELGMEYVSQTMPTPFVPPGIDARIMFVPSTIPALQAGRMEALMSFSGVTGPHYSGPLGQGAGHPIPSAKNSPFAPEGFTALRQYCSAYGNSIDTNAPALTALTIAYQRMITEVNTWPVHRIGDLYPASFWETMDRTQFEQLSLGRDLLYHRRPWIWHTEGELKIALRASEMMAHAGAIRGALTKEEWCGAFAKSLPIIRAAYEATGTPDESAFTDPHATDLRGKPVWEVCGK